MTSRDGSATDDLALLDRWSGGDEAAGKLLLKRYFDVLYRFFANKISSDTDDLVQQTMMALLAARDRFEARSTFRAYLLSIARFQLYEHLRRRKRAAELFEYDTVTAFDLDPSPSTRAAERRDHELLLGALRRIPLNFQIALELHYWEDLSGPELAQVLGVPVDTAYSRVRKARELVRRQLKILSAVPSRTAAAHASSTVASGDGEEERGLDDSLMSAGRG
ncbi:RNA polymerase sigma factor [Pendulispora albinea]|uniref:RNA polymerase sigma factor n=1 Tax=Pendulispora albinea TaxID=2741071 RepID=A0ABZ2LY28_9BACT